MVAQARRLLGENSVVSFSEGGGRSGHSGDFGDFGDFGDSGDSGGSGDFGGSGSSGGPDLASGRVLIVGWWDEVVIFLIPRWFGTGGEWY